jgi:alpha-D-ribose 1-methylphosphonate 5-triphosphate diphosphatase
MNEIDPFDELLQSVTQGGDELLQGTEGERETLYNFAFIDEDSKREVRRRLLKAVALPGHLVPFASRDLPIARGWGTGGLQVTLALVEPRDVVKVIDQGWLLIEGERILALGEGSVSLGDAERVIDAQQALLLPGLIDLHCDAIEKVVEPRPNVFFDINFALQQVDWRLAGSGITTEFHAVSLDDGEFSVRSDRFVYELYAGLQAETDLLIRHKLHVRLELSSENGLSVITRMIERREPDMISLMDHSPGQGQYTSEQTFREYVARTSSRSLAEIDELLIRKRQQAAVIPNRIAHVTQLARKAGIAIATHDDDSVARVAQWPTLGVTLCEFPTRIEAASRAHELGLAVCMDAPNVVRGRSSGGNLSATAAIETGVANVLCSDYYPPAMLSAIFTLTGRGTLTLPEATRLVTLNPARAVGLAQDFGSLEVGKVADIILVALDKQRVPVVRRVFVGGAERVVRY